MGLFKKLFGLSNPADDLLKGHFNSIERSATLLSVPYDDTLMSLAKAEKGHISDKAVSDEYDRLILQKYRRK